MKKLAVKVVVCLFVLLSVGSYAYINDYYHADPINESALSSDENITVIQNKDRIDFVCKDAEYGLVFYPGGKVEFTAYSTLMKAFAQHGFTCVLLKMPVNLAVLNKNAADGVIEEYPEIKHWYIGGHSLGGAMASSYVAENLNQYDGLILLGAYSTANLRDSNLQVFLFYGENDGVMNRDNYEKNRSNLPVNTLETVIAGGNHSGFGDYGHQKKDGELTIDSQKQKEIVADIVISEIH